MKLHDCTLFNNTRINLSNITIREYPSGHSIALESEASNNLGIVLEGKILVKAYTLSGSNFTLNILDEGSYFGDILMFSDQINCFPGSLITQGKTKVALIPNNIFKKFLFNDNDLLKNFLRVLSNTANELSCKNKMLSQDSVRDKILYFLLQKKRNQKSNIIKIGMTKEELANQLFIQRPSLSRELSRMKSEGIIDYDRHTITIKK
jgi:CRP-like cAMP-binding protein